MRASLADRQPALAPLRRPDSSPAKNAAPKVVILAGGLGTRLAEETVVRPKPMVEIGGRPILWHIMKHYARHGCKEFFIALGYKGEVIKRYFLDYYSMNGTMKADFGNGRVMIRRSEASEDWKVHLVDTGLHTQTGGRLKRLEPWLGKQRFMLTYGDGVGDIDLDALVRFHCAHRRLATLTAVRPPARFGNLAFSGELVQEFTEKPHFGEGWISGGFMVLEPGVLAYLNDDRASLEADGLKALAEAGQLAAYRHEGFWQCMDTVADWTTLQRLWDSGTPPWKTWKA